LVRTGVLVAMVAGPWVGGGAQDVASSWDTVSGTARVKRSMTFADLERMKRVSDPQISPSGKWVMFSVTEVDLQKNSKVNHLWVVPMDGSAAVAASASKQERQVSFWSEGESGTG
jgi:hypothetical protein